MMSKPGTPPYPVLLMNAGIGLSGILIVIAPAAGILMAVTALLVATELIIQALGHTSLAPQTDAPDAA